MTEENPNELVGNTFTVRTVNGWLKGRCASKTWRKKTQKGE